MGDEDWERIGQTLSDASEPYLRSTLGDNLVESLEDEAGRFFIIVYNTTTTVSAAYATFIALAIAAALGAILGLIYWALLSSKNESSSYEEPHEGYGKYKRSTKEEYKEGLHFVKILELIDKMETQLSSDTSVKLKSTKNCDEKLFHFCRVMSVLRLNVGQGFAETNDELLSETINEARSLLGSVRSESKDSQLLSRYVKAADLGASGAKCEKLFEETC